jgi:signal transduction histidine kinase
MLVLMLPAVNADNLKQTAVLKVGVYDNPPKIFSDEAGNPSGIFIDILKAAVEKESVQLQFITGSWAELVKMLQQGQLDVLPDMAYLPERDSLFTLSLPVLSSWLQPYTISSKIINKPTDLLHKRIGVLRASSQEEFVTVDIKKEYNLEYTVVTFDTYTQSVEALKQGDIDALIANRFFYFSDLCDEEILASGVIMQISELHFAFSKSVPPAIIDLINKKLSLLINDTSSPYYKSLLTWLNKHKKPVPVYVKVVIALLTLAFSVFLLFTVVLRSRVKAKTKALKLQNNELIKAKVKAEESDRLKTAFLQNLSHEIRTPLNGILGFVNVLQDPQFNDERRNQFIDIVNKSSDRLLSTISDIIEISKIDANQVEVNNSTLNIVELLEQQIKHLEEKAVKNGLAISLNHNFTPENRFIISDKNLLNGIVSRLLNNALKFTKEGSIELNAVRDNTFLVIVVKDTGIGIPSDRLEAIFDRFVNADLKLSRSYDGSGLGLAIVKSYLELLKGSIWVLSEVGKGSSFNVKIPVHL